LHTSISTHIGYKYNILKDVFNVNNGEDIFSSNIEIYKERILKHPERLENLYFLYTFYLRALQKISNFLSNYEFLTGNKNEDLKTRDLINELLQNKIFCTPTFDESILFQKNNFKLLDQMRNNFRNISYIMNCVACEKCKLWGNLQTLGLATSLKIVVSNYKQMDLQRNEIISFIIGFKQISESIKYIQEFNQMLERSEYSFLISYLNTSIFFIFIIYLFTYIIYFEYFKKNKNL
jgi:ERO1-like protein alpha